MNRIKVLFILRDFEQGGIARTLVNLCSELDMSRVCTDVFVCNPSGIFNNKLQNCTVLPYNFLLRLLTCNYRKEHGFVKFTAAIVKLLRHLIIKLVHKDFLLEYAERRCAKKFKNGYDVLWACSEDVPAKIAEYSSSKSSKVLWIHNNYTYCFENIKKRGLPNYSVFDRIVCVSRWSSEALQKVLWEDCNLQLHKKVDFLYNIVNTAEIMEHIKSSCDDPLFSNQKFTIISVGRLAWEKNFESIPQIALTLQQAGFDFVWYIIGGGSDQMRDIIESEIRKNGMEQKVILLGTKSNPYPYIAKSDVLVVSSRYETYPTVVNEAKVLGVPVISTNILGIEEILSPSEGWICHPEEIADILIDIMKNGVPEKMRKTENFIEHNHSVMEKFEQILLELKNGKVSS